MQKSVKLLLSTLSLIVASSIYPQENTLRLSDIITADESIFEPILQQEIEDLEDKLIIAFNASNEIEDFEIKCVRETQNGSYFFRACDPIFLAKERQANALAWRQGSEDLLTKEAIKLKFSEKLQQLDVAFSEMLAKDQSFLEIARRIIRLRHELEEN